MMGLGCQVREKGSQGLLGYVSIELSLYPLALSHFDIFHMCEREDIIININLKIYLYF